MNLRGQHVSDGHRRESFPTLTSTQAAYLAGLFDGEGSVSIVRSGKTWGMHVSIGSSAEDGFLRVLYDECSCPGSFCQPTRTPDRRPRVVWAMAGRAAAWFLTSTLPWLRLKNHQAEIALDMHEQLRRIRGGAVITPREHANRELLRLALAVAHLESGSHHISRWAKPGTIAYQRAQRVATDIGKVLSWQMRSEESRELARAMWRRSSTPFPFYEASA